MLQSKLMLFFSSATEKRKRDSDDSDESQPGPSTPKKTSRPRVFCDDWLLKYDWLYLDNGKMKCHPCINTRQNNPFSAGSGCTLGVIFNLRGSVCDPLKLKMTPKVNYLGVTMTPENFFEGKTLWEYASAEFENIWPYILKRQIRAGSDENLKMYLVSPYLPVCIDDA